MRAPPAATAEEGPEFGSGKAAATSAVLIHVPERGKSGYGLTNRRTGSRFRQHQPTGPTSHGRTESTPAVYPRQKTNQVQSVQVQPDTFNTNNSVRKYAPRKASSSKIPPNKIGTRCQNYSVRRLYLGKVGQMLEVELPNCFVVPTSQAKIPTRRDPYLNRGIRTIKYTVLRN
jgi:hypothetical protein